MADAPSAHPPGRETPHLPVLPPQVSPLQFPSEGGQRRAGLTLREAAEEPPVPAPPALPAHARPPPQRHTRYARCRAGERAGGAVSGGGGGRPGLRPEGSGGGAELSPLVAASPEGSLPSEEVPGLGGGWFAAPPVGARLVPSLTACPAGVAASPLVPRSSGVRLTGLLLVGLESRVSRQFKEQRREMTAYCGAFGGKKSKTFVSFAGSPLLRRKQSCELVLFFFFSLVHSGLFYRKDWEA